MLNGAVKVVTLGYYILVSEEPFSHQRVSKLSSRRTARSLRLLNLVAYGKTSGSSIRVRYSFEPGFWVFLIILPHLFMVTAASIRTRAA